VTVIRYCRARARTGDMVRELRHVRKESMRTGAKGKMKVSKGGESQEPSFAKSVTPGTSEDAKCRQRLRRHSNQLKKRGIGGVEEGDPNSSAYRSSKIRPGIEKRSADGNGESRGRGVKKIVDGSKSKIK